MANQSEREMMKGFVEGKMRVIGGEMICNFIKSIIMCAG
jgi:uncharacterized ion transporter superfamily protein YfcC